MKKFQRISSVFIFISILFTSAPLIAGVDEDILNMRDDIFLLKKEIKKINMKLNSLASGERPFPSNKVEASIDDDPVMGLKNAPVTLIEFSDYECPFCKRFAQNVLPELRKEYINKGKLKHVFRDYPLPMHGFAENIAIATSCANEQGKFWDMHDHIFKTSTRINKNVIDKIVKKMNLNIQKFETCYNNKDKYKNEIKKDMNDAQEATIRGTPSFIIGKTAKDGIIEGKLLRGALPYNAFKEEIDKILAGIK